MQPDPVAANTATRDDEIVEFTIAVERTYKVNLSKIRRDFATELAEDMANRDEYAVLRETLNELCGFDRDQDHIDGSYVWLDSEHGDYDSWLTLRTAVESSRS